MTPAEVLTALGIINGLITLAKSLPSFITHARALLAEVEPHVEAAGDEAKKNFAAAIEEVKDFPPALAPTGLSGPIAADPRLAQLLSERNAAHATITAASARADNADRLAQAKTQEAARAGADRDALTRRMEQIAAENEALKGQLSASEVARQKAERAAQDAQQAAQHAQAAAQAAVAAAQHSVKK